MKIRSMTKKAGIRLGLAVMAGLAALVLYAGCSVGPNYVKPPAPVPSSYKENVNWKVAQPKDELPRGKWWLIYHDAKLNGLEDQVDINNQNIAQAEANFRQALAQITVARAAYFPTVSGGPSWSRFKRSESLGNTRSTAGGSSGTSTSTSGGGGIGSFPGATLNDYLMNFMANWELDIWGLVRRSVESAKASAQASAGTLEGTRLSSQATLAQSYFQIRSLDAQKRLLDDAAADFQKILILTQNRYAQGVASRNDVALAETQFKNTQSQATDLGVQRAQQEHAIATLMGKPASDFSLPPAPFVTTIPPTPAGVPSELLERRPDIATAERNMAAANAQIGVAIAAFFPTLSLSATGGFESSTVAQWLLWPSRFWSLGAGAAQTFFAGGQRIGQTQSARAAYEATVAGYRQTVLTGFQEVEDNLAALRILAKEEKEQAAAVKAAQLSAQLSTNQYKAGTISTLDLMTVLTTARNNERLLVVVQGNQLSASVLLVKALGGGWNASDLPSVDSWRPLTNATVQTSGAPDNSGQAALPEAAGSKVEERPAR
jgi:NodT family efflux transporter outer membrane factor (OMF) lipoprotein